jgi:hypothetical protein
MQIKEEQLKTFIAESGLVSKGDLTWAIKEAKDKEQSIGDVLLSAGKITDSDLKRMQAYILGIPFISFARGFKTLNKSLVTFL